MAVIVKLKSSNWRVQVRRKGKYASRTFLRKSDAEGWAVQAERDIDQGKRPAQRLRTKAPTFGDLIDLHISDLAEVGKSLRRSKDHVLRRREAFIRRRRQELLRHTGNGPDLDQGTDKLGPAKECQTADLPQFAAWGSQGDSERIGHHDESVAMDLGRRRLSRGSRNAHDRVGAPGDQS